MKKLISFIHIERAGGTSLHHLLHYNFKNYKTINPRFLYTNREDAFFKKENFQRLLNKFPNTVGIGGHTTRSFLSYEECTDKSVFYFTFLREPISRYMSHFNYQRLVMKKDWTIEEFIEEKYFNNFQVKRIVGKEDLHLAFEELKKYSFIGLSEKYNESLLLLKDKLDYINFSPLYERKNEIPNKNTIVRFSSLSKEIQEKIELNNVLDIELYSFVKEKTYTKQQNDYSNNLSEDLLKFEKELLTFKYNNLRKNSIKLKKALFYFLYEKKIVV